MPQHDACKPFDGVGAHRLQGSRFRGLVPRGVSPTACCDIAARLLTWHLRVTHGVVGGRALGGSSEVRHWCTAIFSRYAAILRGTPLGNKKIQSPTKHLSRTQPGPPGILLNEPLYFELRRIAACNVGEVLKIRERKKENANHLNASLGTYIYGRLDIYIYIYPADTLRVKRVPVNLCFVVPRPQDSYVWRPSGNARACSS